MSVSLSAPEAARTLLIFDGPMVVAGAVCSAVMIPLLIRWQRGHALGQQVYGDGPRSHGVKQGTPTMGGAAFLVAMALVLLIVPLAAGPASASVAAVVLLTLAAGGVGLIDDLLIIVRHRPLGLKARWKMLLLVVIAVAFAVWLTGHQRELPLGTCQAWFGSCVPLPGWLWFALTVLAIVGAANAVNLTDGVDGLAAGTAVPALLFFAIAGNFVNGLAPAAALGACAVFLWFNRHPAKIFMGDTGSLALGALLAGSAAVGSALFILPILGIVYVAEALSVMLQVASFKATGRRIFRMSPLHHHFELLGWTEPQIAAVFVAVAVAAAIASLTATASAALFAAVVLSMGLAIGLLVWTVRTTSA